MAPHSSTLAWRIPWREEPGRLQSMGSRRVGHDRATSTFSFTYLDLELFIIWKWRKNDLFLCGEIYYNFPDFLISCWSVYVLNFFFFFGHTAQHVECPRPGTEPKPPALEAGSLYHWITREIACPQLLGLIFILHFLKELNFFYFKLISFNCSLNHNYFNLLTYKF